MQNSPAARLRPATPEDRPFLDSLFFAVHADEFAPLNLPPAQLEPLLAMQARAQRESYARDFPSADDRIVLGDDGTPIGRLLTAQRKAWLELVDIALLAGSRGAGIGEALLRTVIDEATALGLPVRLQVRPGNRAFHLYTRLGFQVRAMGVQVEMEYLPEGLTLISASTPAPKAPTEWDAAVDTFFTIATTPPGLAPPLRLARIEHAPPGITGFSLYFHGPTDHHIPQGTFLLERPEHGEQGDTGRWVFLVPVGPAQGAMEYEAVFSG